MDYEGHICLFLTRKDCKFSVMGKCVGHRVVCFVLGNGCVCLQVDKVVQMYETMLTRHTTMIVGPTGGGKSVVINTLCQSQTK